ncbi:VOC family protein [Paraburkholderia bengalensis]|uniref:VOC family protein n=1 Tax=Paraburkholderia bengalensis TaxID=2747562 RepID=UPI003015545D
MKGIGGIDHVAITANDLTSACAFYDSLFGAQVVARSTASAKPCWCVRSRLAAPC